MHRGYTRGIYISPVGKALVQKEARLKAAAIAAAH